jgi:hypothetical protein
LQVVVAAAALIVKSILAAVERAVILQVRD